MKTQSQAVVDNLKSALNIVGKNNSYIDVDKLKKELNFAINTIENPEHFSVLQDILPKANTPDLKTMYFAAGTDIIDCLQHCAKKGLCKFECNLNWVYFLHGPFPKTDDMLKTIQQAPDGEHLFFGNPVKTKIKPVGKKRRRKIHT